MSTRASSAPASDRSAGFPMMERPSTALLLALTSGVLNAWTFATVGTFATVQSGNLITIGYFGAQGDWDRASTALASIFAFGLGATLCAIAIALILRRGRAYSPWVLLFEVLTLLACVVLTTADLAPAVGVVLAVSFIAGIQGNAFHRDHGMLYGNTAMTFVVQMAFSFLGRALVRRHLDDSDHHLQIASMYGLLLAVFATGGAAGFLLEKFWSTAPLLAAALTVLVLGVVTARCPGPVDPQQTAPTP